MLQNITDAMIALTDWLKTQPLVAFIMALVPVFSVAFAISNAINNAFYNSRITEYKHEIDTLKSSGAAETIVQSKNISSFREPFNSFNWLKTKPLVSFIMVLVLVFVIAFGLKNIVQSKNISSFREVYNSFDCNTQTQKISHPPIKDIILHDSSELFWNGELKISITELLSNPNRVNITLYVGDLKKDFTLYIDKRETFLFENQKYFVDALSINSTYAEIAITPENAKTT